MDDLAQRFLNDRPRLRALAHRMLGSASEAEDAVQEAWLKLQRADAGGVENPGGWLTTVVARVCLDMLRARRARREAPLLADAPEPAVAHAAEEDVADGVGLAMLVVLEALKPAERVAFVLHDMFDLPFEEIAPIVGRSPPATRQLASRARRKVQGGEAADADRTRHREVVSAFLAASRAGDFGALLAVLDPDVVLNADAAAVASSIANAARGAPPVQPEMHGAHAVAEAFKGRATAAQLALVGGEPGLVYAPGGKVFSAFAFSVENGKVVGIEIFADPDAIAALEIEIL